MSARAFVFLTVLILLSSASVDAEEPSLMGSPWKRHTIDSTSRGADGARFRDINGDGLPDLTTGWEEGGVVRVYLHPGKDRVREAWPRVTVGEVKSPEDAVFADLDSDGAVDVISSCEGKTRSVFVHWAPKDKSRLLDAKAWTTEAFPACSRVTQWMYALPMDVDGKHGVDLILGAKGRGAGVFWLESPKDPRDLSRWRLHRIEDAGWIMSLRSIDMDGDGDRDVVVTDRKGARRGLYWLKHPEAKDSAKPWERVMIGGGDREVMFLGVGKNAKGVTFAVPAKDRDVLYFRGYDSTWETGSDRVPKSSVGRSKAAALGDIDGDGRRDIVFSCESSKGIAGVVWWTLGRDREIHEISGNEGTKFDRIELLDLDGDGDLDVITCEERESLGVFWYENPAEKS